MKAYLINYVKPTEANCGFRITRFLTSYAHTPLTATRSATPFDQMGYGCLINRAVADSPNPNKCSYA